LAKQVQRQSIKRGKNFKSVVFTFMLIWFS
jgi:hypothetical protein